MEYCLGRKIKNKTDFINVIKENIIRQINDKKHSTVSFYFFDGNDYKIFNNKFKTISKINKFITYHLILAILNDNFKEIKAEDIRKTNEYKKFIDKTLPF